MPPSKSLSCGVIVTDKDFLRVLAIRPFGKPKNIDLPKGGKDPGESPEIAALRELKEETGLVLQPNQLTDLGVYPYTSTKNLHLFYTIVDEFPPIESLRCNSFFVGPDGRKVPEAVGFIYATFSDERWYYSLRPILEDILLNYS